MLAEEPTIVTSCGLAHKNHTRGSKHAMCNFAFKVRERGLAIVQNEVARSYRQGMNGPMAFTTRDGDRSHAGQSEFVLRGSMRKRQKCSGKIYNPIALCLPLHSHGRWSPNMATRRALHDHFRTTDMPRKIVDCGGLHHHPLFNGGAISQPVG
jgi:hypothetical protein